MKAYFLTILLIFISILPQEGQACTLFAAQGDSVAGEGAIIAKNRDFKPQPQSLKLRKTGKYAYYGLFSGADREKQIVKAGVNEVGLAAVTAMASCIPASKRENMPSKPCVRKVLSECATVEQALEHPEFFFGPKYVMLADAQEIAIVEIGEEGKYTVERRKNSYLTHTNFYLDKELEYLNIRVKESPKVRYNRICELMSSQRPFSLENFITFSQDANDGLDNSLWRVGSTKEISQTLASFIVRIYPEGDFSVWIKYRPEIEDRGKEVIVELDKKDIFG